MVLCAQTCSISNFYSLYKIGVAFTLAHPYGLTRVMSSYRWTRNFVNGKVKNIFKNSNSSDPSFPASNHPIILCL